MNLFDSILKMANPETKQAFWQVWQAISKTFSPISQWFEQWANQVSQAFKPAIQTAKSAISPIATTVGTVAKPVVKWINYENKVTAYKKPYQDKLAKLGITAQSLDEMWLSEEEKQAVKDLYSQVWVEIPWLAQIEQARVQEQAKQWEDLGIMWNIWNAIAGWFRVWEQIPRYAGNLLDLTQKYITTPALAGWAELFWNEELAWRIRTAWETFWAWAKSLWEEITKAGEWDITEKQREARRFGASMVATAPIPLGTATNLVKWAGLWATALRWAIAGWVSTPIYTGLEEWRLPTAVEQVWWTVWGAVLWPLVEKVAIPAVWKWIEAVQKKINPVKFTKQMDDETIKLVRQAVRPSISWVDTAGKFDVQDAKLLQWVKEIVKQWKKPTNSKELMTSIKETKEALWNKVKEANANVSVTTNGDDIALKIRQFVNDKENRPTFLSNQNLKSNLLKMADEIQSSPDFKNITQDELQQVLSDVNSRIPAWSFLKQLDANPTQTAQNTIIAKVYKEILDDNLEKAVGTAWKEARQAYWAVRQLEKDFAKRFWVYLRQNPKWLADMFGMEWFADVAVWLLSGNPSQFARGALIQWAKNLLKKSNSPDTIIKDIFSIQWKLKNVTPNIIKNGTSTNNNNPWTSINNLRSKWDIKKPLIKPKNESKVIKPKK